MIEERGAEPILVRQATVEDGRELARLRWEFTREHDHVEQDRAEFTPRLEAMFREFLSSGRWTVWVAVERVGGQLIGTAFIQRVDKVPRPYERPSAWGYVTNVYVEPAWRNSGLGRRLLRAAITEARSSGLELLLLWPSERSVAFYERLAFRRLKRSSSTWRRAPMSDGARRLHPSRARIPDARLGYAASSARSASRRS